MSLLRICTAFRQRHQSLGLRFTSQRPIRQPHETDDPHKEADAALSSLEMLAMEPPLPTPLSSHPPLSSHTRSIDSASHIDMRKISKHLTAQPSYRFEYNAILRYYNALGMIRYSNEVFEDMKDEGQLANRLTFKLMILSNLRYDKFREVMEYYAMSVARMTSLDVMTYNGVLTACVDTKTLRQALSVYQDMKRHQVSPNARTYAIMFHLCDQNNRPDLARQFLHNMDQDGIEHSIYTLHPLLSVLASSSQTIDDAVRLFEAKKDTMPEHVGLMPYVMEGLSRSGRSKDLAGFVDRHQPPPSTYHILFKAYKGQSPTKISDLWQRYLAHAKVEKPSSTNVRLTVPSAIKSLEVGSCLFNIRRVLDILDSVPSVYQLREGSKLVDARTISEVLSAASYSGNLDYLRRAWAARRITSGNLRFDVLEKFAHMAVSLGDKQLAQQVEAYIQEVKESSFKPNSTTNPQESNSELQDE